MVNGIFFLSLVACVGESECSSVVLWRQCREWLAGRAGLVRVTGMQNKHPLGAFAILECENRPFVEVQPCPGYEEIRLMVGVGCGSE